MHSCPPPAHQLWVASSAFFTMSAWQSALSPAKKYRMIEGQMVAYVWLKFKNIWVLFDKITLSERLFWLVIFSMFLLSPKSMAFDSWDDRLMHYPCTWAVAPSTLWNKSSHPRDKEDNHPQEQSGQPPTDAYRQAPTGREDVALTGQESIKDLAHHALGVVPIRVCDQCKLLAWSGKEKYRISTMPNWHVHTRNR